MCKSVKEALVVLLHACSVPSSHPNAIHSAGPTVGGSNGMITSIALGQSVSGSVSAPPMKVSFTSEELAMQGINSGRRGSVISSSSVSSGSGSKSGCTTTFKKKSAEKERDYASGEVGGLLGRILRIPPEVLSSSSPHLGEY